MPVVKDEKDARFTLSIIPDSNIALFHWSGPITFQDRMENRRRMVDFCKARGVHRLIVDGREQESKTDIVDSYEFAKDVPLEMRGLTIAVVHRADDESLPFIETVAFNRGSGTRAFLDFDEARTWLSSLDEPREPSDDGEGS